MDIKIIRIYTLDQITELIILLQKIPKQSALPGFHGSTVQVLSKPIILNTEVYKISDRHFRVLKFVTVNFPWCICNFSVT